MADIRSTMLGMTLQSPVVAGSSGKTDSVERIAELVEAGVGAVVLKSLYEEQILAAAAREAGKGGVVYGHDDLDGFVQFYEKKHSITEYARLIKSCKSSFPVPIIASVNAATSGEWARIASEFAEAGADAVQLNLFVSPFDESRDSAVIEAEYCSTIRAVKAATTIPVIAKIGPYFTSLPRIVMALEDAGADGIVLFNRYYSPDIDTEKLSVRSADIFSQPGEYTLPLRWVSLLSGKTALPLIGSSGIHDGQGLIKMLLAGSPAVEVVSALYRHGVKRITEMNAELTDWMDAHGYSTLDDFRGSLAANAGDNRGALERFHYMKTYGGASE